LSKVTFWAKEIGYTNDHDLVYGLPFQKVEDIIDTIENKIIATQ
jgi:oxygen-independent coproporphyrinogen-3 oxidase